MRVVVTGSILADVWSWLLSDDRLRSWTLEVASSILVKGALLRVGASPPLLPRMGKKLVVGGYYGNAVPEIIQLVDVQQSL